MWVFPVETDGLVLLVILGFYLFIYFYAFIISFIQLNQPTKNNKNKNKNKKEEGNLNKERVYFQTNLETNFSNSLHGY